ncbi:MULTISPECIES: hypothetical protein [Clostridium]|uniref:hypothetical protein n=1 Tax=Clostridium TaxID=1485 RepID=UPI00189A3DE3|nr:MULTISPECIES: hypothetical protein [Clostridium]MDI9215837.1 hypothetical protein [Clostridium tertium]
MKSNIFAIYKGKEYQAGIRADGSVILRSDDESDIINGFIKNNRANKGVKCYKYVLKSEINEIYRKITKAEYCGYEFSVTDERDNMLLICAMTGNYQDWLQLGMEIVDKGIYQKWVEKKDVIIKINKESI